jgi:hypothetical protein
MKPKLLLVTLAFVMLWTSGCATSAVLNSGPKQYRPTHPSSLAIGQSKGTKRLLVSYDEQSDSYRKPARRAYWVDPQAEPPSRPEKPLFVEPWRAKGLEPVAISNKPSPFGYSAVIDETNPAKFTLYFNGEKLWQYTLPTYEQPRLTLKESALLPFAIAADLTIVGGVIFAYAMANSGTSGSL